MRVLINSCGLLRYGVTWLLFHSSNIPNMHWKATVNGRLFQFMLLIWSVNSNKFFTLEICRILCLKSARSNAERTTDKNILQHDNARQHVASVVKTYLERRNWQGLPRPPYSADNAPSDYHFFRAMPHGLAEQHFTSYEGCKRPRVLRTWHPYVARKMDKSCVKRRSIPANQHELIQTPITKHAYFF